MALTLNSKPTIFALRYLLIIVISLFVVHYVSYQKLPFQADYQFPWLAFVVVHIFGITVCFGSTAVYKWMDTKRVYPSFAQKSIQQIAGNLVATFLIYSLLYVVIQILIFNYPVSWFHFSKYWILCVVISLFDTTVLLSFDLYKAYIQSKSLNEASGQQVSTETERLLVKRGAQLMNVLLSEVAYVYSEDSIIYLVKMDGSRIITHYTSLKELGEKLPDSLFFQANRQFIINRNAVNTVDKDKNRKLQLSLTPLISTVDAGIPISRYRSAEFKKWLKMS
ncbi:MAG: LytTR family DNA-binding domain-containing protein [Bacteroidota bacterium]